MKSHSLLFFGALLLVGCNTTLTGYPFKIRAIYQAPRSNIEITVTAQGHVPAGADVSETCEGTVLIEPLSDVGKTVRLVFTDTDHVTYTVDSLGRAQAKWGFREGENSLTYILAKSGYLQVDSKEIAEIVKVIGGVFAGPKAVTLDGQSKHLKVVEVDSGR